MTPSLTDGPQPALLRAVVSSAMDAIVALDAAQGIVLFNSAAEAMFGCPAQEALGRPLDQFLPARFQAVHRRHVDHFGATGDTARAMGHLRPLAAVRANGEEFPIEATIAQVTIAGQRFYAAIIRDITRRVAADETVKRQADLLDLAYDAILTCDWGGPITFWNRGAERMYGYSRAEVMGRICHDLLRTRYPEGRETMLATLEREGVWEGELVQVRRDGREITVESRHVRHLDRGSPYVLEVVRDVTARKRVEAERTASLQREATARAEAEAAAAARDRLQEILNGLPGGVMLLTAPDAYVEFANAAMAELIYASPAWRKTPPVYGQDFTFVRDDGSPLPAAERPAVRALGGERVQNVQLVLARTDRAPLPVAVHAAPLPDGPGERSRAIVFVQDMTQIRQAEQLKDDFLALVSHELRTPLTAIHGGARLLASDAGLDPATRAELLADVVAESERLDRLLGNLISLTNVVAGRLRVSTEPVLVPPLTRRVAAEIGARSPAHAFVVDMPPSLPAVEADPDLLEEMLRNLYENAVKYSPHGGRVLTTAERDAAGVAIHITDEGIGIAPEHVATIFERFRRIGGDPTVRGMGLGLYLSRVLVEAQGGHIEASSPGPGHGATFTVSLPVARGWTEERPT